MSLHRHAIVKPPQRARDHLARAFIDKIWNEARGTASEGDKHYKFYDEYLAVMDMTAEFYLSTVERIFKKLEIAQNCFVVNGRRVDIGKINNVAIMTVEGANDFAVFLVWDADHGGYFDGWVSS